MLTKRNFYAALGKVIDRDGATFSPGLVAEEISRETGRPEETILGEVLEECKELVEVGLLWFSSSHLYIKRDSCLIASYPRRLRQAIAGICKGAPSPT
jgi:hypothetical protein